MASPSRKYISVSDIKSHRLQPPIQSQALKLDQMKLLNRVFAERATVPASSSSRKDAERVIRGEGGSGSGSARYCYTCIVPSCRQLHGGNQDPVEFVRTHSSLHTHKTKPIFASSIGNIVVMLPTEMCGKLVILNSPLIVDSFAFTSSMAAAAVALRHPV
jgi:hypothetical protein